MTIEHSTKRIYSLSQIEDWIDRVGFDWEVRFSPEELAYGRKLYKIGAVIELELDKNEACIRTRIDGLAPYCVLDFEGGTFHWRGSTNDAFISASIAVAGFYEIEELVADIIGAEGEAVYKFKADSVKSAPAAVEAGASVEDNSSNSNPPELASADERMELCLHFTSEKNGLKMTVKWRDSNGKDRSAFGKKCVPVAELKNSESSSLIRLASLARKAGFKYEKDSYILPEILKIPTFLKNSLPEWKKFFTIRKDKNVDFLKFGEQIVRLRPIAREIGNNSGDFDVRWSPCVGDREISETDFQKLFRGTSTVSIVPNYGIVKVSMKDALFVRDVESSREFGFSSGMIPRYMLLVLSDFGERIAMSGELEKWIGTLLSVANSGDLPEINFLRPYQRRGVAWAVKLFKHGCNALIADEMGLGKTVQALSLIDYIGQSIQSDSKKFLVVCPASVIPVWISETNKFYPKIRCGVLGSQSKISDADLWISSYTQLRRNQDIIKDTNFELAVLDEAQFIKNPDAKTTVACSSIKASRRLALTGTPVENRLMDMWTVFRWLMPGLLGTRRNFEELVSGENTSDLVKSIRKQISPFVLRRLKSEVASELPEKIYVDLACPMTDLQQSEYEKLLSQTRECLKTIDKEKAGKITVLSLLTRLRQAACDAALLPWVGADASSVGGKIAVMADKVEELFQSGKKILIFSQFTKFLDLIRASMTDKVGEKNIYELTGATRDRAKPVEEFQNCKGAALMLVSLRAGGTGITLTSADYVFIADPWWNPAVEEQAIDRVHRIGRRGDVFVYRLVAQDTVEQRVRALQSQKRMLFEDLLGGLKDVSSNSKFVETIKDILS